MKRSTIRCCWLILTLPTLAAAAPGSTPGGAKAASKVSACTARAPASAGPSYLLPSQADIIALLSPPPAGKGEDQQRDLQAVLDAQHAAHAAGVTAHAIADAVASCGRFDDVLGPALTAKSDARVLAFLDRAAHEGAALTGPAKTFWKRTRPYASSNLVERLADMAPDWKAPPSPDADAPCAGVKHPVAVKARRLSKAKQQQEQEKEKDKAQTQAQDLAHSSYPSGHSTFATVCAILLADMVPEKRAQLFARGRDFGHSRLVVGAHFPSDVEAGRITGTVATALMMQNAQFQHDYSEARVNLRAALGLPAASPPAAATPNLPTTAAGPSVGAANP